MAQDAPDTTDARRAVRRVCFITTEFHGLFKNGGIGTANTGLALALASAGFDVTVAFANSDSSGPRVKTGNFAELKAQYRRRGLTLDYVPPHPLIQGAFNDPRSASYCVFLYVQRGGFDVVLFNDNGGQGYFSLLAKHTGVWASPPAMLVVAHGPFEWVLELNSLEYWNRDPIIASHMERRSAQLADALVSPSRYLIDWMLQRGWAMPARTEVIQNIVGATDRIETDFALARRHSVTELVFFGRQEVRKGLSLFCDALDLLHRTTDLAGVTVTFLGKFSAVARLHSGIYLAERARRWTATLRLATVYDQAEALNYLGRPGALAVIPSLAENSPCVVAECLQLGLPFIATDSGGTPELIDARDRAACLFPPNAAALAERLAEILRRGHLPANLAVPQAASFAAWLDVIGSLRGGSDAAPAADAPLVSVCLVHSAASLCPPACFQSVLRQTYQRLEIVVAWDGQAPAPPRDDPAGLVPIRVIDAAGAPRDAAARAAEGACLLFIDEPSVVLLPDAVATLVAVAARTRADILTGLPAFDGEEREPARPLANAFPIGGCVELGAVENCFGEAVVFVAARAYRDGPGYDGSCDAAIQDWLFLATSVLAGRTLEVVPAPLFERRATAHWHFDAGDTVDKHRRILQAFGDVPIARFARIIEPIMQITRQNKDTLTQALQHVGTAARDIALRLANIEPNGTEANRAFISYCLERRMIAVALDFALLNDVALLPEAVTESKRLTGVMAQDAVQRRRLDFWHDVDVTRELRRRARAMAPLRPADLVRSAEAALVHPLGAEVGIVKIAAICPPGTGRVRVVMSAVPPEIGEALVAVAVCEPQARFSVARDLRIVEGVGIWSEWLAAAGPAGSTVEIAVKLAEPAGDLLDVYLLSRRPDNAPLRDVTIAWRRLVAEVSVNGNITASAIERETSLTPLPADIFRLGVLLSDVSDFPFPVYVPGEATLLHPLPGRVALVRLAGALPAGTRGLRAEVSVGHAQAHPIDFAIWVRPAGAAPLDPADLSEDEGFSGWFTVIEPRTRNQVTVTLPAAAEGKLDVYLATRAVRSRDVHFCHAYWHTLWALEGAVTLPD